MSPRADPRFMVCAVLSEFDASQNIQPTRSSWSWPWWRYFRRSQKKKAANWPPP